jgi:hypothetical protein
MKSKVLTGTFLVAALVLFGIGAAAQRSQDSAQIQTQQSQTTQQQNGPGMMNGGMMAQNHGLMGGGMMGMMGQMTTHHQEMVTLMNKLRESMAAIQDEKDPAALKSKLGEHRALLDQMHAQMIQQGNMMQMMSRQATQNCPAAGEAGKPPAK